MRRTNNWRNTGVWRGACSGYSSIEYAGSKESAMRVLASWTPRQLILAAFSAGFHFCFMFLYSSALSLALAWAAGHDACPPSLVRPMCILALLQPVGLFFDAFNQSINIHSLACTTLGPMFETTGGSPRVLDGPSDLSQRAHVAFGIIHVLILSPAILLSVFVRVLSFVRRTPKTAGTVTAVNSYVAYAGTD